MNNTETMPLEDNKCEGADTNCNKAFLKVKFNHDELILSEEEARTLAQKGLNYDKIYSQLEALKGQPDTTGKALKEDALDEDDEVKQIKEENEVLKQKLKEAGAKLLKEKALEQNKKSSIGSVGMKAKREAELFTKEELATLSKSEIKQNLDKALKSLSYWSRND